MGDITNSGERPSQISETIQDFGFLLVVSLPNLIIEQVSQNISHFIDYNVQEVIGEDFRIFLEKKYSFETFPYFSKETSSVFILDLHHKMSGQKVLLEFSLTRNENQLVVEVIPLKEECPSYQVMGSLSLIIDRIEQTKCLKELYQTVIEEIQNITGFDRVMLYQFDEEFNGTVIAEKLMVKGWKSYLGLRFPATNAPDLVKRMYCENTLRFTPNVSYTPSSMIPEINPRTNLVTDLGKTLLRSPFSFHLDSLKKMEVGASLSITIMNGSELWGLIACHHRSEKMIGQCEKSAIQILGKVVSSLITSKVKLEDYQYSQKQLDIFEKIQRKIELSNKLFEALTKDSPSLLDLNPVEGSSMAMCYDGKWFLEGNTPTKKEILQLVTWIKANEEDEVFVTDSLSRIYPPSAKFKEHVPGLLAINFPYGINNFILWFRPEMIGIENWAVDLRANVDLKNTRLKSIPWKQSEIGIVKKLKRYIIESELLRQYKAFQVLADSVDHYIWVSLPDGTSEYYNRRWKEVTGLGNDLYEEISAAEVIHPDDLPKVRELWLKAIKNGTPYTMEMRIRTRNGDYQWILVRTIPAKNDKGKIIKWYGSGVNIDPIKKIEEELKDALQVRDEFISMASHELKTPITSLGLLLELSHRTLKKSNVIAPYIEKSVKELKRLRYLVDDLLDVSKISSGKMDLLFHVNDLNKIIIGVLERYQGDKRLDNQGAKFEKSSPVLVECDAFRIEQVLTNLISNALKYGNNRPIEIELFEYPDSVVFAVKDQGVGISPQDQGKVFDRFERVGHNSGISGLGLGLYICKNIVDAHQGEIKVQSDLGKGTIFEVRLKKKLHG